jgi:hypothetical protein
MTYYKFKTLDWEVCGELSHRLFLLPYYTWLANKAGRKLLIKYGKPHPMEAFFVPPEGGGLIGVYQKGTLTMNWRLIPTVVLR